MPSVIPITDFRKDIFNLADELAKSGGSLVVTKDPGLMFRFTPVKNDKALQAGYVLKYVLPKLAGAWADIPEKDFQKWKRSLRNDKGRKYKGW